MQDILSLHLLSPRKEHPKYSILLCKEMLKTGLTWLMANTIVKSMQIASECPNFLQWPENSKASPRYLILGNNSDLSVPG